MRPCSLVFLTSVFAVGVGAISYSNHVRYFAMTSDIDKELGGLNKTLGDLNTGALKKAQATAVANKYLIKAQDQKIKGQGKKIEGQGKKILGFLAGSEN
jgi:hypothetical protein